MLLNLFNRLAETLFKAFKHVNGCKKRIEQQQTFFKKIVFFSAVFFLFSFCRHHFQVALFYTNNFTAPQRFFRFLSFFFNSFGTLRGCKRCEMRKNMKKIVNFSFFLRDFPSNQIVKGRIKENDSIYWNEK